MSLNAIDLSAWVIERAIEDVLLNNRFASITDIEKKIKEAEVKGKKAVKDVTLTESKDTDLVSDYLLTGSVNENLDIDVYYLKIPFDNINKYYITEVSVYNKWKKNLP